MVVCAQEAEQAAIELTSPVSRRKVVPNVGNPNSKKKPSFNSSDGLLGKHGSEIHGAPTSPTEHIGDQSMTPTSLSRVEAAIRTKTAIEDEVKKLADGWSEDILTDTDMWDGLMARAKNTGLVTVSSTLRCGPVSGKAGRGSSRQSRKMI